MSLSPVHRFQRLSAEGGDDRAVDTTGAAKPASFTTPSASGCVRTSCSTASTCTNSTFDSVDSAGTSSSSEHEQTFDGDETARAGIGSRLFHDGACSLEEEDDETKTPATANLILPGRFDQKVDLIAYIGTALPAIDTGDPLIEMSIRGFEPRVYLYGGHDNSKSSIASLTSLVLQRAEEGGISNLSAKHKRVGGKYDYIFFQCGVTESCSLKFSLRYDVKRDMWYLKIGDGCPFHSSHDVQGPTKHALYQRKRRRKEKEDLQNSALEQFGLTSSDFDGDSATHEVAAAAAVAASAAPKSIDPFISSGRCYLLPPVIEYRHNDIMASCSCAAHASKHFWVGPKPDGMDEIIAKLCASCGFNDEANKCSCADVETAPSPGHAKSSNVPTEDGVNRQLKRVDKDILEKFNSDEPFYAIKISKPTKAKKAEKRHNRKYQFLSISGFPANTNPVASCSRLQISKNAELIMQNDIIEAGKELFASRWVEEAETRRKGSSSKYYTLLLHDHNAENGISQSGLSSIYFRPLENTKYWWLSYLTTREGALTERKGYGSMMMWRFINMARRAEGVEEIWLEVRPELMGARKMYAKLGFLEVDWDDLPKEIEDYVMVSPDILNPQAKVKNRVYQHRNEFKLMRLNLLVFPEL